ncbi:MAG: hypothetical protein KIT00_08945 [Rhodospirillales bacterium]|nr:hypothetical protein [Rhodospirillales bacterium]
MKNGKGRRALIYGEKLATRALTPWTKGANEIVTLRRHIRDHLAMGYEYYGRFDVMIDAGDVDERLAFVTQAWPLLLSGGLLVLPDANRSRPVGIAIAIAFQFFREIDRIDFAPDGRDVTTIHKCVEKPYVNWNKAEGRAAWQIGDADLEATLRNLGVKTS